MRILTFFTLLLLVLSACTSETEPRIIGVKIYECQGDPEALFSQWDRLGINAAFASQELISRVDFREAAMEHDVTTFVIFPVFFNPEALTDSPELFAITAQGKAAKEEWVEFVCPSRKDYRKQLIAFAKQLIRDHDPDGISIDFIRHFVYWEKVCPERDPSTLPVTCFDSFCLEHFQSETGILFPDSLSAIPATASWILEYHKEEWTDWKCDLISSMVEELADAVRSVKPEILINVHLVPWAKDDFQGAIRHVAGQDIRALSDFAHYLSPMTYSHMLKQDPPWIHSIAEDVYQQTGGKVIPSIQVDKAYLETEMSSEEFKQCLDEALRPPSAGVVLWSWERVSGDPEKLKLLREASGRIPGP